jgi:hypothetical protein
VRALPGLAAALLGASWMVLLAAPADGAYLTDGRVTFGRLAAPGTRVTVTSGGVALCTAEPNPRGSWSCGPAAPLADGRLRLVPIGRGGAGLTATGTAVTITVDTTPPKAPWIKTPDPGGFIIDRTPTLLGRGEPGAALKVTSAGGEPRCTATVDVQGDWSCTVSTELADGPQTFVPTAIDRAGRSTVGDTVTVTLDTTPPRTPTVTAVTQSTTIGEESPTLSGRADSGDSVAVTGGDGTLLCSATVVGGLWSCTGWVSRGPLRVVASDRAARTSAAVTVPASDLRVELDLPDRIVDSGVATAVVRANNVGASGIVVTLTLPEGLLAAGAATGAHCTGDRTLTCALDRPMTPAAPPAGPNGQPVSLVPASELGGSTLMTVPLKAAVLCRSVPLPVTARASVTNTALDLDRTNNSDTDGSTLAQGGIGCQALPGSEPKGVAAFLYIGLLLGSLGLTVGLGGWAWARRSDRVA